MTTPGSDGHRPGHIDARNDLSGTIHGPVVQAATIHGGITYTVQQAPPTGLRVTPDEIPPLMVRFINRTESLAALEGCLAPGRDDAGVGFAVLHGPPGVGKTALVSRWAEQGGSGSRADRSTWTSRPCAERRRAPTPPRPPGAACGPSASTTPTSRARSRTGSGSCGA
ncbi:ATP-binding protein [Streptomyces cyaneofuscatus]|uniref:ATP-binding protein n=1 Tax=Streptomyces cyaneofuscatus TaxID=66883 RepID=UPI003CEED2F0